MGWTENWVKVPKCALAVWCLASNSLYGGQKCSPYQPPYLEFENQARRAWFLVYDIVDCTFRISVCIERELGTFDSFSSLRYLIKELTQLVNYFHPAPLANFYVINKKILPLSLDSNKAQKNLSWSFNRSCSRTVAIRWVRTKVSIWWSQVEIWSALLYQWKASK